MEGSRLQNDKKFNFSKLDECSKWKKCFEQKRNTSGLDTKGEPG